MAMRKTEEFGSASEKIRKVPNWIIFFWNGTAPQLVFIEQAKAARFQVQSNETLTVERIIERRLELGACKEEADHELERIRLQSAAFLRSAISKAIRGG